MNSELEVILISDKLHFKVPDGTRYVYKAIPDEFAPYIENLINNNKENEKIIEQFGIQIRDQIIQIQQLKETIEKAKEYIKTMVDSSVADESYDIWYSNKEYLLNILNGDDK